MWQQDFGAPFQQFATGDLNGDGDDEWPESQRSSCFLLPGRNLGSFCVLVDLGTRATIPSEWTALAIGNTHVDPSGSDELGLSRNPGTPFLIFLNKVFRCCEETSAHLAGQPRATFLHTPASPRETLVGAAMKKSISCVQEWLGASRWSLGPAETTAAISRYSSTSCPGRTRFRQVATGDLDGDARAEVVVSSADEYLQYMQPESSRSYTSFPGVYDQNGILVIGDIDGPNESACGPIYLPIVLKP